jgi:hypothetical protein
MKQRKPRSNIDRYATIVKRNKHDRPATNKHATPAQKRNLVNKLGLTCAYVFEHYMDKANSEGYTFHDKQVAKYLGLTEYVVQKARIALTRYGWFYQNLAVSLDRKKERTLNTFLGEAAVHEYHKYNSNAKFEDNFKKLEEEFEQDI